MAPLTAAEKQRRYREKLKQDRDKYEEAKKKHREHYHKVKKLAKDLTPREKKHANLIWKLRQREYRKKKKNLRSILDVSPPSSPTLDMQNIPNELQLASPASISASRKRGRKKVKKDRSKVYRKNKKLQEENEKLRKKCEMYKKRLVRNKEKQKQSEDPKLIQNRNLKLLTDSIKERSTSHADDVDKRLSKVDQSNKLNAVMDNPTDMNSDECRACLQKIANKKSYDLFEAWFTPWAVRGAVIAHDLSKFADVEISEYDKHSKVICPKCYNHLTDACTFMITVQMSDSILRQRVDNSSACAGTPSEAPTWPQPILLNQRGNVDNRIEIEIKREVLSDENVENEADVNPDWEPMMDIKIEPEEISAPVLSNAQVNGDLNTTTVDPIKVNSSSNNYEHEEYLDSTVKQEHMSGDEQSELASDLPLDCMLCFKVFNSVSGLKAHVISQHSYGTVKRKAESNASPVKKKVQAKEFACNSCNQRFATRTEVMVHSTSHGAHVCFVCDRQFASFKQLARHGRCRRGRARVTPAPRARDLARPPLRPPLSQPVSSNEHQEAKKTEEIKSKDPAIKEKDAKKVQKLVKLSPAAGKIYIEPSTQSENKIESKSQIESVNGQQNLEVETNKSTVEESEYKLLAEIKQEPLIAEVEYGPLSEKNQESGSEKSISHPSKVNIEDKTVEKSEIIHTEPENILSSVDEQNKDELIDVKQSENKLSSDYIKVTILMDVAKSDSPKKRTSESPELNPTKAPITNSVQNVILGEIPHQEIIENSLLLEPVSSLPNKDNKISSDISDKSLEDYKTQSYNNLTQKDEQCIEQGIVVENTSNKNEDSNVPEEVTPIIENVSEMKVHLAINPDVIFETEMDVKDRKCEKSEPKLVSVNSEQSE